MIIVAQDNRQRKYNNAFASISNIITPKIAKNCSSEVLCDNCDCHVFHQYTLKVKNTDRDALVQHLNDNGIPCGVYYPIPLHKQKAYRDNRYKEENFKITNQLVKEVISLPMHTELEDSQIHLITQTILNFINK